jgi:alkanesulfonate monooxygenase
MSREILLNAFSMNCVAHQSSGLWRHPRDRSRDYLSLSHWQHLARTLERGLFDGIFLADVSGVYDVYQNSPDTALRTAMQIPANDPFCLIPAMAATTEHLGFGVTGSIPYEPPYAFARRLSTLDHLTDGRIAWNVVTGYLDSAARAAGNPVQRDHDTRYDMADEYMALMYKLWEGSWEDDAVRFDPEVGVFADPEKVHEVIHHGTWYDLEAIHLCEPSPQRTPVIFQAGSSPRGQTFAGQHAECVFVGATTLGATARLVRSLRQQAENSGRDPADLRIFSLLCVIADETDAAAEARREDYRSYALPEGSLALMSGWTGVDLGAFGLDDKAENVSSEAMQTAMSAVGSRTVRDWGRSLAVGGAANVIAGSPGTVADGLERWMEETGVDGFNLAYTVLPECFEDFVDLVVPELQKRGVYKTAYTPGTLRNKLFGAGSRLPETHPAAGHRRPRQGD